MLTNAFTFCAHIFISFHMPTDHRESTGQAAYATYSEQEIIIVFLKFYFCYMLPLCHPPVLTSAPQL